MRKQQDSQAEVKAAKERLNGFIKPASRVNHHDSERMARVREGRQDAPRVVSWAELGRKWRMI